MLLDIDRAWLCNNCFRTPINYNDLINFEQFSVTKSTYMKWTTSSSIWHVLLINRDLVSALDNAVLEWCMWWIRTNYISFFIFIGQLFVNAQCALHLAWIVISVLAYKWQWCSSRRIELREQSLTTGRSTLRTNIWCWISLILEKMMRSNYFNRIQ